MGQRAHSALATGVRMCVCSPACSTFGPKHTHTAAEQMILLRHCLFVCWLLFFSRARARICFSTSSRANKFLELCVACCPFDLALLKMLACACRAANANDFCLDKKRIPFLFPGNSDTYSLITQNWKPNNTNFAICERVRSLLHVCRDSDDPLRISFYCDDLAIQNAAHTHTERME